MNTTVARRGVTMVGVLVVVVIIVVLIGLLIPAIDSAREAGRRANCLCHEAQLGLAIQNYASTNNNRLPPSASLVKSADGGTGTVGGWSFLVRLLPFMEYDTLYKTVPADGDPEDTTNPAIVALTNTQLRELICPSNPRTSAPHRSAGITNSKAMGATTRGSLVMAVNPQAVPPYGVMSPGLPPLHPDGAFFPGNGLCDIPDGTSHTIMTIETIDEAASRWMVGKEATLVGLPQKSSPTGATPQAPYNYFAPPGSDATFGDNSGVAKAGLRTYLAYDFRPTGADAGAYEDPGFSSTPAAYGPSSMHPGVVICGMADGSTQALSKQIDAANLFFLITKNNSDPFFVP